MVLNNKINDENKKILTLIVIFLVLSIGTFVNNSFATDELLEDNYAIDLSFEDITPYPVEPGQDFSVQILVTNGGYADAKDLSITYEPNEYFTLIGNEDNFKIFNLNSLSSKDNRFIFRVSHNAISGEYPLTFKVKINNEEFKKTTYIKVIGKPDIIFEVKNKNDLEISPKDNFKVKFKIKNIGTGIARNIKLVPKNNNFNIIGENLILINELTPNSNIDKEIEFKSSSNLNINPNNLNFEISYIDEKSNNYKLDESLGINIISNVKLNIASLKLDPAIFIQNKKNTISFRVENLGEGDANNIVVNIISDDFDGLKTTYLGKLEENEDAPAIFTIIPKTAGINNLNFEVIYNDDLGEHKISKEIQIFVKKESKTNYYILSLILILILVYFGYKKINKNKK